MDKALMSSGKDDWGTPQELYNSLNKEFGFTLDACADQSNYKHENYYTIEDDGLKKDWGARSYFATRHIARERKATRGKRHGLKNALARAANMARLWLCYYRRELTQRHFINTF